MRSSGNPGGEQREPDRGQAHHAERDRGHRQKKLYIVGIGPGDPDHLSGRARRILETVDVVAGYTTYIDLIRPLVGEKRIVSTGMKKEVERVEAALEIALGGESCAIVSSGDPGIYAMAGLVFEMCKLKNIPIVSPDTIRDEAPEANILQVEVAPGIPALCSGAALLGAPLTHDFAAISLSNLLTPWDIIERRLEAAAAADFVIVLYNPKSKRRTEQLEKAQKIVLRHRSGETPVGVVTSATREGQQVRIVPLEDLHTTPVNMQTTVFIGSSASTRYLDFMVTPRGYSKKYKI